MMWVIIGFVLALTIMNAAKFVHGVEKEQLTKFEESKDDTKQEDGIPDSSFARKDGRRCPAHRWRWHAQPGMEDENIGYLKCADCLKTPQMILDEHAK